MPTIVHFEVPSDNLERTKRFYTELFGWKMEKMQGHTIVKLTPEQKKAWRDAAEPLYASWVAEAGTAGHDGKAALQALRTELEKRDALN